MTAVLNKSGLSHKTTSQLIGPAGSSFLTPRYYQQEAHDAVFRDLKSKPGCSPLVILPTGTGKSFLIAMLAKHVASYGLRTLILAHKQELVEQNRLEMEAYGVDCGTLCAGLGKPDVAHTAVSASIQTMHSRFQKDRNIAGSFKLIIIDEAHMVNNKDTGRYREFIKQASECMPGVAMVGTTATPFRSGQGYLTQGPNAIYTHIAYEYSIKQALADKFLCPLVVPKTATRFNTSSLVLGSRGDYTNKSLSSLADQTDNTHRALDECIRLQIETGRKGVIVFGSTKQHCYDIEEYMQSKGQNYKALTDDTSQSARRKMIKEFKAGKIQGLISRDILTTGFNAKHVDMICFLRKTASLSLWIQALGRGMRILTDKFGKWLKQECLVADFCGNIGFHPMIDAIDLYDTVKAPVKREKKKNLDEAVKVCDNCTGENKIYARRCEWCDTPFSIEEVANHVSEFMSTGHIISPDDIVESGNAKKNLVYSVMMFKHPGKGGKPPTLKISYNLGIGKTHDEYVPIGRRPFSGVDPWAWSEIFFGERVMDVETALKMNHSGNYKRPKSIKLLKMGKYNKIFSYIFESGDEVVNPMFANASSGFQKSSQIDLFK